MKKLLFALMFSIILISFANAESIGTFKQGENITLPQLCSTCTSINITSITSPQGVLILSDIEMNKDGSYFTYNISGTYTDKTGVYSVNGIGDDDDCSASGCVWAYTFEITPSGREFTTGTSIVYVSLFLLLIFLFVGGAFVINLLPASNTRDEEGRLMSISWLKYLRGTGWFVEYILFVAIMFVASNIAFAFLSEELFGNLFFAIYRMAFLLAPLVVILWICWIFVKIFQDKKFWGMMQRGIFPTGDM